MEHHNRVAFSFLDVVVAVTANVHKMAFKRIELGAGFSHEITCERDGVNLVLNLVFLFNIRIMWWADTDYCAIGIYCLPYGSQINGFNSPCMQRLFPLPMYLFLKTAVRNGGISFKGLRNLPSWWIKMTCLEPLRWIELTKNKKINRHVLPQDPIFVLGFYRSGTTFLHEFLAQDERLGYHTNYQMILPDLMLTTEKVFSPFMETLCKVFNFQDPVHRTRLSFRGPGEEDAAMTTSLNPRGAQWGYFFPRMMMEQFRKYVMFEDVPEEEVEVWKEDYLFMIKKISLANGGRQLVLKSPPNTARVKLLLSMFPRAKFILIHRNPYEVYASNQRFWQVTNRIYALGKTKDIDPNEIILHTYSSMMKKYLAEKDLIPPGQGMEVAYTDLVQQPMENMRKIYSGLGLHDFGPAEARMQAFVDQQKSYVKLKHDLPDAERLRVTEQFGPYIRHWGYPLL